MSRERDELSIATIPPNFENGWNYKSYHFEKRKVIECILLGLPTYFVLYNLLFRFVKLKREYALVFAIAVAILIGTLCITGINDDFFTRHLKHVIKSSFKKRTAYYNPRIKEEARPYLEKINMQTPLVPEKIYDIYVKYSEKLNIGANKDAFRNIEDASENTMIFKDDTVASDGGNFIDKIIKKMKGALENVEKNRESKKDKQEN